MAEDTPKPEGQPEGQGENTKKERPELLGEANAAFGKLSDAFSSFNALGKLQKAFDSLKDKLPDEALPKLQEILTNAGKRFDEISNNEEASVFQKLRNAVPVLKDLTSEFGNLAKQHLGQEAGVTNKRGGTGVNLGLLGGAAATAFVGQKIATGKDGEEVGGARKLFGRVLQVAAAAVAAVASLGMVQGKSGLDVAGGWRGMVRNQANNRGNGQQQGA